MLQQLSFIITKIVHYSLISIVSAPYWSLMQDVEQAKAIKQLYSK